MIIKGTFWSLNSTSESHKVYQFDKVSSRLASVDNYKVGYDTEARILSEQLSDLTLYEYDSNDQLIFINGDKKYNYDKDGLISSGVLDMDAFGRLKQLNDVQFTYDDRGKLKEAFKSHQVIANYYFDETGNFLGRMGRGNLTLTLDGNWLDKGQSFVPIKVQGMLIGYFSASGFTFFHGDGRNDTFSRDNVQLPFGEDLATTSLFAFEACLILKKKGLWH